MASIEMGSKHARQSVVYIPSAPQCPRKCIQIKLMTHEGPTAAVGPFRGVESNLGFLAHESFELQTQNF